MTSVWKRIDPNIVPTVVTDGYRVYSKEILAQFSEYVIPKYRGRGRPPHAKTVPKKGLRYGVVIKARNGKRMETVSYESIIGVVPPSRLNTSCVERMNLSIRNSMARNKRKSLTFSKSEGMLNISLDSFRAYYNLCRTHEELKKEHGKTVTPAMSLGLTDHVWKFRELMSFLFRQNTHYNL
jgi:IS1 family transposase